ncbi:hypothetical protein EYC84_005343 [Monilinia fructicola]|uniref:Uncharacterized protein n=1 Tax=Monilinia fructicola TaxID=38448 RepID=A0A5M9JW67_MONFR|nr:hypothetical protein EYC84_005343 [Monilinia fructicola]
MTAIIVIVIIITITITITTIFTPYPHIHKLSLLAMIVQAKKYLANYRSSFIIHLDPIIGSRWALDDQSTSRSMRWDFALENGNGSEMVS